MCNAVKKGFMSRARSLPQLGRVVLLVCASATCAAGFSAARDDLHTVAIVKVLSNGKVVATYKAIDKGRMEGPCYVFHIRSGLREPQVRVCSAFIVEEVP
jgi:hypothetical protein